MLNEAGGFIRNTVEPLIQDVRGILDTLERHGIANRYSLGNLFDKAFCLQVITVVINAFKTIVVASLLCWTALQVL